MVEKIYNSSSRGADYMRWLDTHHPNWWGVELFGPPGAGKSHISRALTNCGIPISVNLSFRNFAEPFIPPWQNALYGAFPEKWKYKLYKRIYKKLNNFHNNKTPKAYHDYIQLIKRTVYSLPLPVFEQRLLSDSAIRAVWTAYLAESKKQKIVIDEGFLETAVGILVRIGSETERTRFKRDLPHLLTAYPADPRGLLVTCDPEECLRRQAFRGKQSATAERPQALFHDCANAVYELCVASGWQMAILENSFDKWSAPEES